MLSSRWKLIPRWHFWRKKTFGLGKDSRVLPMKMKLCAQKEPVRVFKERKGIKSRITRSFIHLDQTVGWEVGRSNWFRAEKAQPMRNLKVLEETQVFHSRCANLTLTDKIIQMMMNWSLRIASLWVGNPFMKGNLPNKGSPIFYMILQTLLTWLVEEREEQLKFNLFIAQATSLPRIILIMQLNKLQRAETTGVRPLRDCRAARKSSIHRWWTFKGKERSLDSALFILRPTLNRRFWSRGKTWTTKIRISYANVSINMLKLRADTLRAWKPWKIMWNCVSVLFIQNVSPREHHLLILKLMMKIQHSNVCTNIMKFSKGRKSGKKTCSTSNSKKIILSIQIVLSQRVKIRSTIIILRVATPLQREKHQSREQIGCIRNGEWEKIRFRWRDGNFKLKKTRWRNLLFQTINSSLRSHPASTISYTQLRISHLTPLRKMLIATRGLTNYIARH